MDVLTKNQRRYNMSQIRGKNTKPEIIVRSIVHKMGFRFRLHSKNLPGKPDLVLKKYGKIIFVHGCFWHMHNCKYGKVYPKTNAKFWQNKRMANVQRDKNAKKELTKDGWQVLVVWECWTRNRPLLKKRLKNFLLHY